MSGRCGCSGTCTCDIRSEIGLSQNGTGTANNPLWMRFDPRAGNILGSGLAWSEATKKLSAHISGDAGNATTIGTDGGIYTPSNGEGGGEPSTGVSVGNLPATDLVGGFAGAGYLHTPENLLRSYQRAVTLGLDFVHVPVQALRDGTAVSWTDGDLSRLTDGELSQAVADLDTQRWSQITQVACRYYQSGGTVEDSFVNTTGLHSRPDPTSGFFGYGELPQQGGTFCADIAHQIGGRIVLVWQLFDSRPVTDLLRIIRRFGLAQSSIVVSSDLTLLDSFRAMGCAVGGVVSEAAHLTSVSPDAITAAGGTWAVVNMHNPEAISDEAIRAFPEAGLSTIGYPGLYHSDRQRAITPAGEGGLGLRGAMTADPVYYSGSRNGYTYRHDRSTWGLGSVEYGQYNPRAEVLGVGTDPWRRGYLVWGHNSLFLSGDDVTWRPEYGTTAGATTTGPWWLLLGWLCPLPDTTTYTLGWWSRWRSLNESPGNDHVCVAFGVPTDRSLRTGPDLKGPADVGYVLKIAGSIVGDCYLEDHKADGTVDTYPFTGVITPPVNSSLVIRANDDLRQNTVEMAYIVQVDGTAGTIKVLECNVNRTTGRIQGLYTDYTHPEITHTGPYVYVGKSSPSGLATDSLRVTFRHFTYMPGVVGPAELWPWAM